MDWFAIMGFPTANDRNARLRHHAGFRRYFPGVRIAPGVHKELLPGALRIFDDYRTTDGLYLTCCAQGSLPVS